MKSKILIILFLMSFLGFSQSKERYILLDSLEAQYNVKKYTLNTFSLYHIDKEIQMYNILQGNSILLISVLPDLLENQSLWQKVQWEEIQDNIIPTQKITQKIVSILQPQTPKDYSLKSKEFYKYSIIKKENNHYYKAKYCLFEWFYIVDFKPYVNISQMKNCILNLGQKFVKRTDFEEIENYESSFVPPYLRNVYLSQKEDYNNKKIYHFWTFDGWTIKDGYNEHRGIDRFAYIEGKGIVGGSYDFYFSFSPKYMEQNYIFPKLTSEQWIQNRKHERIMWAKELFPERQ